MLHADAVKFGAGAKVRVSKKRELTKSGKFVFVLVKFYKQSESSCLENIFDNICCRTTRGLRLLMQKPSME